MVDADADRGHGSGVSEIVKPFAETVALSVELVGVVVIALFVVISLTRAAIQMAKRDERSELVRETRHRLARGILLGLEFLVAADIIHTVAVELSFTTVGTLAVIVVVRTFLSYSIEVELNGRWPWQRGETSGATD